VPDPFDHVITYVPALKMFLDSTSSFTPMGSLPDGGQDKPVPLTATGTLARTPASSAEQDQTDKKVCTRVYATDYFAAPAAAGGLPSRKPASTGISCPVTMESSSRSQQTALAICSGLLTLPSAAVAANWPLTRS